MTVKYKPIRMSGYGAGGRLMPRRLMTAEDLGLDLLREFDPHLLAVGIEAPHLTRRQLNIMHLKAAHAVRPPMTDAQREALRDRHHFYKTIEGKKVKQEVRHVLGYWRLHGEVKR